MRNRIDVASADARFWAPKSNAAVRLCMSPICRAVMRRLHQIDHVEFDGLHHLNTPPTGDSVLVCPNHSYTGDASVILQLALRRSQRRMHFMAAKHVFARRKLIGWAVQRMGGFSIDREGTDRNAIRKAIELLGSGAGLIVFPEGEIYHLNERLTPLREGVAFMAVSAQRDLIKSGSASRVWMIPTCIRYAFTDRHAVEKSIDAALTKLERHLLIRPAPGKPLHARLLSFGEAMLTLLEKQHLGRSYDHEDEPLNARLNRIMNAMLDRLERAHFDGKPKPDESVPVRVKLLRQHLLDRAAATDETDAGARHRITQSLDEVHRVLQFYSYPGDYLMSNPSLERMAETIEKYQEDVTDEFVPPIGRRRATMTFGEPIDVRAMVEKGKTRAAMGDLTEQLESTMSSLIARCSRPA